MSVAMSGRVGQDAIAAKGWLRAQRWLILRRLSQFSILSLFLLGPWAGVWIVKGNLNASLTLDVLPLTDPFVFLQTLLSGHIPATSAVLGALIVAVFYALMGRTYCSWVCPVNPITDLAAWLRSKLGWSMTNRLSASTRYWLLAMTLILAAVSGVIVWEWINPVSMLHRGLIFGIGLAWLVILGVFLFDLLVSPRGWCSHICPMGAFYSLLGHQALLRVSATQREHCNDCADCYAVCPEPQIIKPALKGAGSRVILAPSCTNCGRCIDICGQQVFQFASRFENKSTTPFPANLEAES